MSGGGGGGRHTSVISSSRPLVSPMSTLGSPMNGLASPYSVITSSLGSPSISLPSTPGMGFSSLHNTHVHTHTHTHTHHKDGEISRHNTTLPPGGQRQKHNYTHMQRRAGVLMSFCVFLVCAAGWLER